MPDPIVIARCILEIDLEGQSLPKLDCKSDRERTVNPELLEGYECKVEFRNFKWWPDKDVHVWATVCRPAEKVDRQLRHEPTHEAVRRLKEAIQNQGKSKPSGPAL